MIQTLFEAQVQRMPDAVALSHQHERMTYQELNERSNQLAHYLQTLGVGPEVLVALYLPRSIELIIAFLAIIKAGGAYVPVDATYPLDRLAFILNDTQAPIVITHSSLQRNMPNMASQVLCLDALQPVLAFYERGNPACTTNYQNLAYAIYTSGSTGEPKGVLVEQQSLLNLIDWHLTAFAVTAEDRASQFASISFDASVWEIWPYLLIGASVHLIPDQLLGDPEQLQQWLLAEKISISFLPTIMAEALLRRSWHEQSSLRILLTGGDRLRLYPPAQLPFKVINNYGPTEATVVATSIELSADAQGSFFPSIGWPITNVQVYLLDQEGHPVPIGETGELCIGGQGLARGYLKRPLLTLERFIPDPFGTGGEARLYKTGDFARMRSDGALEFLGRLDQQVKLRGFRIELGEIEATLNRHPAIQESLTLLHEDGVGESHLLAYFIAHERASCESEELKRFLAKYLPAYMLPRALIRIERWPLTLNGKLDTAALPLPFGMRPELHTVYVEPQTPVEKEVAAIWRTVLQLDQVGRNDHFFDLGGNSLQATQIVVRLREQFAVTIELMDFFDNPTIALQSTYLEESRDRIFSSAEDGVKTAHPAQFPLSFAQEALWMIEQFHTGLLAYTVPLLFHLQGRLHLSALEQSLSQLILEHESLRTVFVEEDEEPVQKIMPAFAPIITWSDLSLLNTTERTHHIRQAVQHRFDLEQGPLFLVKLIKLQTDDHLLLLLFHHIIIDWWSVQILFKELSLLYTTFSQPQIIAQPDQLRERSIFHAVDYAIWQRQYLQGSVLTHLVEYWKKQLSGTPFPLPLPTDHPRPLRPTYCGAIYYFTLNTRLSYALRMLSRKENCTLFMTLLTAAQLLLKSLCKVNDIVIGSPTANRTQRAFEPLVGYFVNILLLRTNLAGNPDLRELLARVRETTLGAYQHRELPFELLVQHLQPYRDHRYLSPLFQVAFQCKPQFPELTLPHLQIQLIEFETTTSRFDLNIEFEEAQDQLKGMIEYNTDIFMATTIQHFAKRLEQILWSMTLDPTQQIDELLAQVERNETV
ncbi:non-ribosomal peptide synthetase [Tengunoibacter tsumagoiensis]|uniref:Carrier domain-containing protein n=1 Tax=Tengunoibacter tsumagoiensis TaxID=2014871 RepID=A0A402A9P8_9CHLR|nr:non-ribosomal peptide synthetase [Tengunoibacter tsumagoiensis]GCE15818.1 hypothetical protein KTT_56770 [Tengunoibacter tsumagoiensis]